MACGCWRIQASRFWSKAAAGTLPEESISTNKNSSNICVCSRGPERWHTGNNIYCIDEFDIICIYIYIHKNIEYI